MCIRCAGKTVSHPGIHRELGVRNTFVRSADLDGMEKKYVEIYEKIGRSRLSLRQLKSEWLLGEEYESHYNQA